MSDQEKKLEEAVALLSDWVDSCQIFVTWREGGETQSAITGSGNNFATLALVSAWLRMQDAVALEPEDDDEHPALN